MSYNILAALYLNLEQGQEDLFFPYCPKEYQEYIYRYPVLMREIPGLIAEMSRVRCLASGALVLCPKPLRD